MKKVPQMRSIISPITLLFCLLTSCGSDRPDADGMYDSGFSDGYATGYNTTCQIRATLINDYDDENYRRGYNASCLNSSIYRLPLIDT